MIYNFSYDPKSGILHGKFRGAVTDETLRGYYEAAREMVGGLEFRGSIMDFSAATSVDLKVDTLRELAALPGATAAQIRVIVAPSIRGFDLALLFQEFGQETRPNLFIVRSTREALAIFDANAPVM